MNALNYEEAVHKLLKVQIDDGQEVRSLLPLLLFGTDWTSYRLKWRTW